MGKDNKSSFSIFKLLFTLTGVCATIFVGLLIVNIIQPSYTNEVISKINYIPGVEDSTIKKYVDDTSNTIVSATDEAKSKLKKAINDAIN